MDDLTNIGTMLVVGLLLGLCYGFYQLGRALRECWEAITK